MQIGERAGTENVTLLGTLMNASTANGDNRSAGRTSTAAAVRVPHRHNDEADLLRFAEALIALR